MSATAAKHLMHEKVETDMLEEVPRKERSDGEHIHHSSTLNEVHLMEEVARKEQIHQVHEQKNKAVFDEIRMRGPDGASALRNVEPEMMEAVARKERDNYSQRPPKYWRDEMSDVNSEVRFLGKMEDLITKM